MERKAPQEDHDYIWIPDRGGNSLKMQRFQDQLYYSAYKPHILQGIKEVKLRPDDVYLSAYLRTGTHWIFEMVSMLLNQKAASIEVNKEVFQLEYESDESLTRLSSPRIINTHMSLLDAPTQLAEKKCKIIFTLRDPKDVAVSLYHLYTDFGIITEYKGKFNDFLYLFLDGKVDCGGLFQHWRSAEQFFDKHPDIPVHFMAYEETLENPVAAVKNLSDFIGLPREDTLCQQIAQKCHISKMKADKIVKAYNDSPLLYRKGVAGDWRNYFTEEMLEDYYRVYEEKMAGSRFYGLYSRDKDI